jgi:hypothetical protein
MEELGSFKGTKEWKKKMYQSGCGASHKQH